VKMLQAQLNSLEAPKSEIAQAAASPPPSPPEPRNSGVDVLSDAVNSGVNTLSKTFTSTKDVAQKVTVQVETAKVREWKNFEAARRSVPKFITHVRTFENWMRPNGHPQLAHPVEGPCDVLVMGNSQLTSWIYVLTSSTYLYYIMMSAGYGLLSGFFGTLMYIVVRQETFQFDAEAWASGKMSTVAGTFGSSMENITETLDDMQVAFAFLPSFLLFGFVGFAVDRWRSYQMNCYSIQGRVQDVGMLVAGSVIDPANPAAQRLVYNIYRYLNLVHAYGFICTGKAYTLSLIDPRDWAKTGLTTPAESEVLAKTPPELRETVVISWIARGVSYGAEKNLLNPTSANSINLMVHELRMFIATTPAIHLTKQPNMWSSLMQLVVNLLLLLYVVGIPFTCFSYDKGTVQYFTIAMASLMTFPWICMLVLIEWLNDPFSAKRDAFNADGLICWSERITFTNMRTVFSAAAGGGGPTEFDC